MDEAIARVWAGDCDLLNLAEALDVIADVTVDGDHDERRKASAVVAIGGMIQHRLRKAGIACVDVAEAIVMAHRFSEKAAALLPLDSS